MSALDAHNLALDFLTVAVEALDTLPDEDVTLAGAPDRQYVAPGQPVVDCEQVVAWFTWIEEDSVSDHPGIRAMTGRVNLPALELMVVRCIPAVTESKTGRVVAPSAAALTEAARQTDADAWVVWEGLNTARKQGRFNTCAQVTLARATPLNPSGGMGGWKFPVYIQLDGYTVPLGS